LGVDKLPRTRGGQTSGFGEPLRILIDLEPSEQIIYVVACAAKTEEKLFLANNQNRGFIAPLNDLFSSTRNGKQIFVLDSGEKLSFILPIDGDHMVILGENRKMLIFPLDQLPELSRGKGQFLQKHEQGTLSDIKIFTLAEGLVLKRHGKTYIEKNLSPWIGKRNTAGRLAPLGFPRDNKFPQINES
jgi:topoisomerase-4 subunit A